MFIMLFQLLICLNKNIANHLMLTYCFQAIMPAAISIADIFSVA